MSGTTSNPIAQYLQNFITMAHDPSQEEKRKNEGAALMMMGGALSVSGVAQLIVIQQSILTVGFPLTALVAGYDVAKVGWNLLNMKLDRAWLKGAGGFLSGLASGKGASFYLAGCDTVFENTVLLRLLARAILEHNR